MPAVRRRGITVRPGLRTTAGPEKWNERFLGLLIVPLLFSLFLTGCATTLKAIPRDYVIQNQGNGVVIGRFEYQYKEGKRPWLDGGFFGKLGGPTMYVEDMKTGKDYAIKLDGAWSDFYVELPPGRYRIKKWVSGNLESGMIGRFEAAAGQVVYVGTLRFVRKQGAGSFASQVLLDTIPGKWSVSNEHEEAAKKFREKYPRIDQEIVTSLIDLY
jgi:hypothetical protein